MKNYTTPKAEIMELKLNDVITISAEDFLAEFDDTVVAPSTWF